MLSEPSVVERKEQPYVYIPARAEMDGIGGTADTLIPELFGWLARQGLVPVGAPFLKYNAIDVNGQLEFEWGLPTGSPAPGDGRVLSGVLPAGQYAALIHRGPYGGLMAANTALLEWVREQGRSPDVEATPAGDHFRARYEVYATNPAEEPDPENWETEVTCLLAE